MRLTYTPPKSPDAEALWKSMSDYERWLWQLGCTLDQIQWYREKLSEYPSRHLMQAEFPSSATEAFANTGSGVFAPTLIDTLRARCSDSYELGELSTASPLLPGAMTVNGFVADPCGHLKVWSRPRHGIDRYVVSVDIGGRTDRADFSGNSRHRPVSATRATGNSGTVERTHRPRPAHRKSSRNSVVVWQRTAGRREQFT